MFYFFLFFMKIYFGAVWIIYILAIIIEWKKYKEGEKFIKKEC